MVSGEGRRCRRPRCDKIGHYVAICPTPDDKPPRVRPKGYVDRMRLDEIVAMAETAYLTLNVLEPPYHTEARAYAMRAAAEAGYSAAEIRRTFKAGRADLQRAGVLDHKPSTRMLPIAGNRRDCANEAGCLAELVAAASVGRDGRDVPVAASCPSGCAAFAPYRDEHAALATAGLGAWD